MNRGNDSASNSARVNFRGRGPKGYRPSDERIRERVCDALADDPEIDASEIEVDTLNGEVTLRGEVETRHAKWLAETIAAELPGVVDVCNRIRSRHKTEAPWLYG